MEKILKLVMLANSQGANISFEVTKNGLSIYIFNELNKIEDSHRIWFCDNNTAIIAEIQSKILEIIGKIL